ncbi:hypothetical protein NUU61_002595 [Penicillium alfredii]|uniref:Uncharacterized protein n=1 Tax=Penicillium alfredii TaxID=1506179 RepID=A0A9W9FRV1_9EURO|nr:uncharacterized protein NUU61_002595 [Penicillium alfredii]KAJ5105248.1 hypothetical protein NUU61_002595 [Penicillium alfredii]
MEQTKHPGDADPMHHLIWHKLTYIAFEGLPTPGPKGLTIAVIMPPGRIHDTQEILYALERQSKKTHRRLGPVDDPRDMTR